MKFFIDTANVEEIRKANDMGIIAGVTTNPSLLPRRAATTPRPWPRSPQSWMAPSPAR